MVRVADFFDRWSVTVIVQLEHTPVDGSQPCPDTSPVTVVPVIRMLSLPYTLPTMQQFRLDAYHPLMLPEPVQASTGCMIVAGPSRF
ncbi:hypothetical protein O159_27220 [Leifsonia xyli subsp. cynodontis DSM 46306]|uniref:Uncharacterized protein n=1 Tax=Leifsonia xyli subsp. cynodontis DSM 46306 TaxID=1389489 RepID=U3PG19_LEIXC|nr:hypothetical protein O159_27220 [Leifsonia xyli subsp. cynodontis DSM 46306]